ncbi:MAG: zinc ribbon domain-containing protein [Clostridia bacterium]|nr:zinc ribbon domain-containing protein [Clostridia bacterium]
MYCKNCGTHINDSGLFCKMCGTKISQPETSASQATYYSKNASPDTWQCFGCGMHNEASAKVCRGCNSPK